MKEFAERVTCLESNTPESQYPTEYLQKARDLIKKRQEQEDRLRKDLPETRGRDDRLSRKLLELDAQLRKDISKLRKEFCIETV